MERSSDVIDTSNSENRFVHRALVGLGIAAAYAVLIVLLWYARDVFFIAFAGILFAIFLSSLAGWLARHSFLSHTWGLVVTVVGLLVCLGLIGWLIQARLLSELQQFSGHTDSAWTKLTSELQKSSWGQWLLSYLPERQEIWNEVVSLSRINQILGTTLGIRHEGRILRQGNGRRPGIHLHPAGRQQAQPAALKLALQQQSSVHFQLD